jgi:hypothetical protein
MDRHLQVTVSEETTEDRRTEEQGGREGVAGNRSGGDEGKIPKS